MSVAVAVAVLLPSHEERPEWDRDWDRNEFDVPIWASTSTTCKGVGSWEAERGKGMARGRESSPGGRGLLRGHGWKCWSLV